MPVPAATIVPTREGSIMKGFDLSSVFFSFFVDPGFSRIIEGKPVIEEQGDHQRAQESGSAICANTARASDIRNGHPKQVFALALAPAIVE